MSRAILAIFSCFAAIFVGCDSSTSPDIPSGKQNPGFKMSIIRGTKAQPDPAPVVRIEWVYADSIKGAVMCKRCAQDSIPFHFPALGSGHFDFEVEGCKDSSEVIGAIATIAEIAPGMTGSYAMATGDTTVYCK